jgi:hypothetical protein
VSARDGERGERVSALLLLAAVALAAHLGRADLAGAVAALDEREVQVRRLEATVRVLGRDARGLPHAQLEAALAASDAASREPQR